MLTLTFSTVSLGVSSLYDNCFSSRYRTRIKFQGHKGFGGAIIRPVEAEALVIDLCASMAHKVTGVQAEIEPTIVARVIRYALEHLSARSDLVIKVHEDDLQVARKFSANWVEKVSDGVNFRVENSDQVERGGCMIGGAEESVDAWLKE